MSEDSKFNGANWKRYVRPLGKPHEAPATFHNRVKKSMATNGATYDVLCAMLRLSEFNNNTVTATRAQISAEAHKSMWSVKVGLEKLRKSKIIHAVAYGAGGRNCPTTYAIIPAGEGVKRTINLAEGWGQDHPAWLAIGAKLRADSRSRWDNLFCLLKFFGVEEGTLFLVAPNAWLAEKIERNHIERLKAASIAAGYPVEDVRVEW